MLAEYSNESPFAIGLESDITILLFNITTGTPACIAIVFDITSVPDVILAINVLLPPITDIADSASIFIVLPSISVGLDNSIDDILSSLVIEYVLNPTPIYREYAFDSSNISIGDMCSSPFLYSVFKSTNIR